MATLETAWAQAAELAADDAAVATQGDAVDLAAALVKLSRLVPVTAAPVCTVGFVSGSLRTRVARLLSWAKATPRTRVRTWYAIPPVLATLTAIFVSYTPVLRLTHTLTEWLVR